LKAAIDPNDSVGIIDSYFSNTHFFTEFERFDRHIDKMNRSDEKIDYISICSPNYLHDAHCRFAMRAHADAICEKPLVLNPWNIDGLQATEQQTGRRVSTIMQLRLHPATGALREKVANQKNQYAIDLIYVTSRGPWYHTSWKGDEAKSGGVAMNIGIHFFDMLSYIFGPPVMNVAHLRDASRAAGYLICGRASIRWFLSIDRNDLPPTIAKDKTTYRSITIDNEELEFSDGFNDLHTSSYQEIIGGRGFRLDDVRRSIEIVSEFRNSPIKLNRGERHPLVTRYVS
jgi:UDP-N-acetyl-2-amino-2-deoxyglucuronate dehydrogenase